MRPCSFFDVKAWYVGESKELEKWIGAGFYNTLFKSNNEMVTVYYERKEIKKFEEVLDEKLNEDLFDNLCDNFFSLIDYSKNIGLIKDDIFEISVKCWSSLTIFDLISKYPEYATENMLRRLIRLRQTTESFHYNLSKKVNLKNSPKDYLFFGGKLVLKKFEDFIKKRDILIINK